MVDQDMATRRTPARRKVASGRPAATVKAPAEPAPPETAPPETAPPETAPPETAAPGQRPVALRASAAAQAVEAAGLAVAAIFAAVATANGRSYQLASGIALTLIALGTAAGLAAIAAGLARAKPWSRTPAVMTQLFVVIAGFTLLDGHRPEWGVPALLLAAICVAGLLTPASLRALNRPRRTP
jgi:hypothetical protein